MNRRELLQWLGGAITLPDRPVETIDDTLMSPLHGARVLEGQTVTAKLVNEAILVRIDNLELKSATRNG